MKLSLSRSLSHTHTLYVGLFMYIFGDIKMKKNEKTRKVIKIFVGKKEEE